LKRWKNKEENKIDKKVLVIGLDAAPPELVFDRFTNELPTIGKMIEDGISAKMKSCHPPITIPAWMVMATGKDPGELGIYGFRHRRDGTYNDYWIANSHSITEPPVWNILSRYGKRSCLVGVPPSYPPRPITGNLVSCFVTPGTSADKGYTYPAELSTEIEKLVGTYLFDVEFRIEDRDRLQKQIFDMTEQHFNVLKHLLKTKNWDFTMFVEIGVDRIQHAFWKFLDEKHPRYVSGSQYEEVIEDYYKALDLGIQELLDLSGPETVVLVVSDHGAKMMKGAFSINQWLEEEGYLTLKRPAKPGQRLEEAKIDWEKTSAWGWGGYYARIFLNVKGREDHGLIDREEYEEHREEVAQEILGIRGPEGEKKMRTRVIKPDKFYHPCRGTPPDLMVYLDDLFWRSAGTLGYDSPYLSENDTGPDDAVHSQYGIFLLYDTEQRYGMRLEEVDILDIAPTIMKLMSHQVPSDMKGEVVKGVRDGG
jgi:predicted AlkP superfamily phosphohydrolase/phosphomutase